MSAPQLFTCFDRPPIDPFYEKNSGEEIVEKEGYLPANLMIENMIYAGQRLDIARSEYYDFPDADSVDQDFIDPTRSQGFDISDASNLARSVEGRIAEQRKLFEKERIAKERLAKEKEAVPPIEG